MPMIYIWTMRLILLFALLSLIYVLLGRYSRWNRRKELETEYDSGAVRGHSREDHVSEGMARYDRSLTKRLLLGVFVLPLAVIALLIALALYA